MIGSQLPCRSLLYPSWYDDQARHGSEARRLNSTAQVPRCCGGRHPNCSADAEFGLHTTAPQILIDQLLLLMPSSKANMSTHSPLQINAILCPPDQHRAPRSASIAPSIGTTISKVSPSGTLLRPMCDCRHLPDVDIVYIPHTTSAVVLILPRKTKIRFEPWTMVFHPRRFHGLVRRNNDRTYLEL